MEHSLICQAHSSDVARLAVAELCRVISFCLARKAAGCLPYSAAFLAERLLTITEAFVYSGFPRAPAPRPSHRQSRQWHFSWRVGFGTTFITISLSTRGPAFILCLVFLTHFVLQMNLPLEGGSWEGCWWMQITLGGGGASKGNRKSLSRCLGPPSEFKRPHVSHPPSANVEVLSLTPISKRILSSLLKDLILCLDFPIPEMGILFLTCRGSCKDLNGASQVAPAVRSSPANTGDARRVPSLSQEDTLEEEMATYSSILA